MSKGHGPLADRPDQPVVGPGDLARERGPARHRRRAVHPGPGRAHARHAARLAGPGPARARPGHRAAHRRPAYDVPGVVRVLTAAGRARAQRRRREARRAAVPHRGHVLRARGLLGARRDAGGGPAGRRQRSRSTTSRCPSLVSVHDAIEAESFQGHQRTVSRGDADAGARARPRTGSAASSSSAARSTSTWRPTPRWRWSTRTARSSSSPAPSTRPRPRTSSRTCSACRAHQVTVQCLRMGGGLRRQGVPAARAGRDRRAGRDPHRARPVSLRLNRTQDITMTGKRHPFLATWEVGLRRGQAARARCAPR